MGEPPSKLQKTPEEKFCAMQKTMKESLFGLRCNWSNCNYEESVFKSVHVRFVKMASRRLKPQKKRTRRVEPVNHQNQPEDGTKVDELLSESDSVAEDSCQQNNPVNELEKENEVNLKPETERSTSENPSSNTRVDLSSMMV